MIADKHLAFMLTESPNSDTKIVIFHRKNEGKDDITKKTIPLDIVFSYLIIIF